MSKGKILHIDLADRVERAAPDEAARIILQAGWKQAGELIFEHPEPEDVVRAIPEEDIYLLIKQTGETDALDIFALASSEQVQAVFDFDCWDQDQLSEKHSKHWFKILMEMEDDIFIDRLRGLDISLLVLFCKRRIEVLKFEEIVDDVEIYGPNAFLTPDRRYMLVYNGDESTLHFIHAFTQRIYRLEMDFYYYLLEAIYWESISGLEENAFEDRTNRMEGRGFPDYYSAIEIFAPVNPEKFHPGVKIQWKGEEERYGIGQLRQSHCIDLYRDAGSFLNRLLAMDFPGKQDTVAEAISIANMVAVAEKVSFADLEGVKAVVEGSNGYLNIGLEYIAGDKIDKGIDTLRNARLADIYRIGRSLVGRLGKRAQALVRKAAVDGKSKDLLMLDSPHQEFVLALLNKEPRSGETGKRFACIREVEEASTRLDELRRVVDILHDECGLTKETLDAIPMLGLNQSDKNSLGYAALFCTAYANDICQKPFAPMPLQVKDLPKLMSRFGLVEGKWVLTETAGAEFDHWLEERSALDLRCYFDEFLAVMAEELGLASKKRRPDVRYLSSLLMEIPY